MWNFAQLIHRAFLIMEPNRAFEPEVVPDAITAAGGAG
jgi:hypothetical protein